MVRAIDALSPSVLANVTGTFEGPFVSAAGASVGYYEDGMDEILWHRRESRRPTEKTNIVLELRETPAYSNLILSKRCRKSAIEARKQSLRTVSTKSGRMDRERCAAWSIQPVTTLTVKSGAAGANSRVRQSRADTGRPPFADHSSRFGANGTSPYSWG